MTASTGTTCGRRPRQGGAPRLVEHSVDLRVVEAHHQVVGALVPRALVVVHRAHAHQEVRIVIGSDQRIRMGREIRDPGIVL